MDIKEIIQIYGLPEDASEEDVRTAMKAGAQAIGDLAAERARAESSEDDATPAVASAGSLPTGSRTAATAAPTSSTRSPPSASSTTPTFQNFDWQTRNNQ